MLDLWTHLASENLNPAAEQAGITLAHAKLADAYVRLHQPEQALSHLRIAVQIDKQLVDADRNSISRLRKLFVDYSLLSITFRANESLAAPGEARGVAETAAKLAGQMLAADPNNSRALFDVMTGETLVGDWLRDHDEAGAAVPYYRKAVDAVEKYASTGTAALLADESLIYAHQRLASGLGKAGQLEESLEHCRKAEEYADRADKLNPGLLEIASRRADIHTTRAQAYGRQQRWQEAIDAYRAADLMFEELRKREPRNEGHISDQAASHVEMADCYAALERWPAAIQAMQAGLDGLREVAAIRPLLAKEEDRRRGAAAKLGIWMEKAGK